MPFPKKQTLTAARVVARCRNALESTGPRPPAGEKSARPADRRFKNETGMSFVFCKIRFAVYAPIPVLCWRHGVNAANYLKNSRLAGEPTESYEHAMERKSNRQDSVIARRATCAGSFRAMKIAKQSRNVPYHQSIAAEGLPLSLFPLAPVELHFALPNLSLTSFCGPLNM